jgi:uncharacterized membrane protein HdeD (DUF308 family)
VSSPDIGVATLALLVGIGFILRGVTLCVTAWLVGRLTDEARHEASQAVSTS